jgi:hypothetical protein
MNTSAHIQILQAVWAADKTDKNNTRTLGLFDTQESASNFITENSQEEWFAAWDISVMPIATNLCFSKTQLKQQNE